MSSCAWGAAIASLVALPAVALAAPGRATIASVRPQRSALIGGPSAVADDVDDVTLPEAGRSLMEAGRRDARRPPRIGIADVRAGRGPHGRRVTPWRRKVPERAADAEDPH